MTRHLCIALTALLLGTGMAEATDHPPGYVLQETIIVPVDGSVVMSASTLAAGVSYKVRASGTFAVGGPGDGQGDAEYANFSNPPGSLQDACGAGSAGEDLGIGINDTVNDSKKFPGWGVYSATHQYTIDARGTGARIQLNYHDCVYQDNNGSLTVEIFRPAGLTVELNQTAFRTGQTMVVTASLTPGYIAGLADAYVVIQAPNGAYYSLTSGRLVPGIVPFATGFAWPAAGPAPTVLRAELLRYRFTGAELPGTYTWYSAGAPAGTLNIAGPLAVQMFTFAP
jgi:hypothetical protein